jgi:broad specificity phosphatase PhoE
MEEKIKRPNLLVLVRHAESKRNAVKKGTTYFADEYARAQVKGIRDDRIPITDLGWQQSKETGIFLREKFGIFDYVYNSGYLRTVQTMNGILEAYSAKELRKTKICENHFIRERHAGYTYDMTEQEAEKHFPYLKEYWQTHGGYIATPVGGESLATVVERVYMFINMLIRDRADKKILVVTHGGTLRCFRKILEHWDYDQAESWAPGESPKNCSITVYKYDKEKGSLKLDEHNTIAYKETVTA